MSIDRGALNIVIRPCQVDDLPAVLALMEQLSDHTHGEARFDLHHMQRLFTEMAAAPTFYLNLVCEVDGHVVGFLSLIFYRTLFHQGGTALINELVIDREQRRRGLGRMLITRAIEEAKKRGMDEIEVGTEKDNLAAQRFYRQVDFNEEYVLLGKEF